MSQNLSIESPDFDAIQNGDDAATSDAVRLLWQALNFEMRQRRSGDRNLSDRLSPRVLSRAPTGGENNVDTEGAGVLLYTGSSSVTITGYRAREEGDILFIHNVGSGTITHAHESASSDAANRMTFQAAANKGVGANRSIVLQYLSGRWREMSLA
jgi:hypothetical protein